MTATSRDYAGVNQRHRRTCTREGKGSCPWGYHAEVRVRGQRVQEARSGYATKTEANGHETPP